MTTGRGLLALRMFPILPSAWPRFFVAGGFGGAATANTTTGMHPPRLGGAVYSRR